MAKISRDAIAAVVYFLFSAYLFYPFVQKFPLFRYLVALNCCIGAFGCYILSKRWVEDFIGRFFAGLVYGFGPFMLCLVKFHPAGGFMAAVVPWMFWPAALMVRGARRYLQIPLSVLPFIALIVFSRAAAMYGLFAIPLRMTFSKMELAGLISPLAVADRAGLLVSFYHTAIGPLIIGLLMLFISRRYGIMMIILTGLIFFVGGSFEVSPALWLAIPMSCFSVLIGEGIAAVVRAGVSDSKWVLFSAIVLMFLAIVSLLLGTRCAYIIAGMGLELTRLFTQSAKMYVMGAVAIFAVFFIIRSRLKVFWLRWFLIGSAMLIDIVYGALYIVDKLL